MRLPNHSLWRIVSVVLVMTLAGAILSACGGGDGDGGDGNGNGGGDNGELDSELVSQGEEHFTEFDCDTCHSISGEEGTGPPLDGLYQSERELESGETVTADDEYLRTAILEPSEQVVAGYSAQTMEAAISGDMDAIQEGDTVDALVEYIKSLE